ncbi:SRPBCC domain-containing protein [Kribbella sp. NBC_01484]|uniref:SRPBCC domain-containing protein n=1 Tax=Kribbella sp. NBC_01484 TaxID=2903579 RepID=UPI002E31ECBD|nr:SRPBCC domain-containing protein [Kribbella sp. NBC_01484]
MTVEQGLAPLVKKVVVPVGAERAFEAFTAEISAWWPLPSHSVGDDQAREVRVEGAVGGRIVEYGDDGEIATWGTVSDWDPPKSVSFTWHPGSDPRQAGQVTVTFSPVGDDTEVELVHSGWERRPDGVRARAGYDTGWDYVLGRYVTSWQ